MALSPTERLMSRRQIDAIIRSNPVFIVFHRAAKVRAPGGGWRFGPSTPLRPQQVTVTALNRRLKDNTVATEMGDILDGDYVVTGRYNLDIERDDEFDHDGDHYKVIQVVRKDDRVLGIAENTGGDVDG